MTFETGAARIGNARSRPNSSPSSLARGLRTVTTESSVWIFDLDNMRYLRLPKTEAPGHGSIPYTGEWDAFTRIEPNPPFIIVHRPVPFGTGALRQTGPVLHDTGDGPWPRDEEDDDTNARSTEGHPSSRSQT